MLAKYLFKKKCYGVQWIYAEIMEVNTTISSEKNLAEKIRKIKPKIRISQAFPDSTILTTSNKRVSGNSNASLISDRSSLDAKSSLATIAEGTLIVIDKPIFSDVAYQNKISDHNDSEKLSTIL